MIGETVPEIIDCDLKLEMKAIPGSARSHWPTARAWVDYGRSESCDGEQFLEIKKEETRRLAGKQQRSDRQGLAWKKLLQYRKM